MSVKAKVEAIIYATEEPVSLNQLASLLKDAVLAELRAEDEARLALNEIISSEKPELDEDASDDEVAVAEVQPDTQQQPDDAAAESVASEDLAQEQKSGRDKEDTKRVKEHLARILDELTTEYNQSSHGVEVRQIAGGYRMGTKPEHHDVVVRFAKSLKPPVRLSLQALETLAVIAYKQPVTVPEVSEIRGVDSSGVIGTLLDRKLISTAGRKQVIGRPILYKTTKEFLLRFGLNNVAELPSMEEFEKLGDTQAGLFTEQSLEPTSNSESLTTAEPDSETSSESLDANPGGSTKL
ncbi:MAG: SMC-Scp complex subunit ScpB [Candidatus Korobacteraceae bacterium]